MNTDIKEITIAVSAALQDAGEATRSLEIVKGIRENTPENCSIKAVFLSHGGRFEQKILDNGFAIYNSFPRLEGVGFHNDMKPSANNFIGSSELTVKMLEGEIKALEEIQPDVVLYGFWPFASLARRMVSRHIPGICFLPIPLEPTIYCSSLMKDIPDQIKMLTFLPERVRRTLMRVLPISLKLKAPILRQQNMIDAAKQLNWQGEPLQNLFDLLKSDITVVNDLDLFYKGIDIPSGFVITGPLYSQPDTDDRIDVEIRKVFEDKDNKTKLFCTMGSSGRKETLLEAVKAIALLPEDRFTAVILVPKSVCPINEVLPYAEGKENLYMTDQFVPAKLVNRLADIVISHGGQGTVQTAMASGTPIVGVAMQPEQQINLDNVVLRGAAIRIPITRWKEKSIRKAINKIDTDKRYRKNAAQLADRMELIDGKTKTSSVIWEFIRERI